jgi:G3E family GTPase
MGDVPCKWREFMGQEMTSSKNQHQGRVPFHIISGFLGVGKTTAILNLLARLGKKEQVVVLINEWGQIGLDAEVVGSEHPTLAVREISGGCICCTAGAALHQTMMDILTDLKPDRIIIEPSGVAKPGEIMDCLQSPDLADRLDIRPVIGLVDPVRFLQPAMMKMPIYRDQVDAAAILVANRCDTADQETIQVFLEKAAAMYPPKKAVHTTRFGKLPLEVLVPFETMQQNKTVPGIKGHMHTGLETMEEFKEAGWAWPAGTIFVYGKLQSFFKALDKTASEIDLEMVRAKGVFHTDHGWFLMELATGSFYQREIQYRGPSRCQLITSGESSEKLQTFGDLMNACRRKDQVFKKG